MTSAEEIHFRQIPWCADLLRDPEWKSCSTSSRKAKGSTEDSFFAETLKSDRTIRKLLSMYREACEDLDPPIREVRTLMDLGNGVNGHPDLCHGGFVATMLDEVCGVLLTINLEREQNLKRGQFAHTSLNLFTAYININYKKPVPTPSVVLCTAKIDKRVRNKLYVLGTVEDGNGTIYATSEALFVEPRSKI
ncbi:hypothetical protein K432DRAFT_322512 [Lepidopterella palustris CBS 459.81]|uniref:Thioesterase domain-containing protein n=1 Tax=Lepidopterella palustris CBS 459.81 TaxID=1314670 RepID=A0A8E2EG82_9PEZI|nr:hypothetical protein K432DRAFT_322512 [Lepidopterella palustris CBS 459.81]